jgi:hypothetical protein
MSRLAELLERPRELLASHTRHSPVHHPKSSIFGIVLLALGVIGFVVMWPELQRYLKIRRM